MTKTQLIRPFGNETERDDRRLREFVDRKNVAWVDTPGSSQVHLLMNFLEVHNSPSSSVVFIIHNSQDVRYLDILMQYHESRYPSSLRPISITNEQTAKQRKKLYRM